MDGPTAHHLGRELSLLSKLLTNENHPDIKDKHVHIYSDTLDITVSTYV